MKSNELTPIVKINQLWVKRDDLFTMAGVCGGKARTCWGLAQRARGLVTAGSRTSPQINIVSHIAQHLGIPCRAHCPTGELSPELVNAQKQGAEIIQHSAGYNTVIKARANGDAVAHKWTYIPFGMECQQAVADTSCQVKDLPDKIKRVVMVVGTGIQLCGVWWGLWNAHKNIPVVGIRVGADPTKTIAHFIGDGLRAPTNIEIIDCKIPYHVATPHVWNGIDLDPIYEAKVIPFLRDGDLFWIVGRRVT